MITSKDNARVKRVAQLTASARKRRENGVFLLEGTRLCQEALQDNLIIQELYYTASVVVAEPDLISALSVRAAVCEEVSEAVFAKMSDTCSPQGILLVVAFTRPPILPKEGRFLAFEKVSDPSNLGAAARTAEALGFAGLLVANQGVDPFSPKSLRASMGALLRLPVCCTKDFLGTLQEYRQQGFTLNATVVDADATPVQNISFGQKEIVLIGNEANGLSEAAKTLCDRRLTIPMVGRAESLNAAMAATIVMWEMGR